MSDINAFKKNLINKKVAVLGAGVSNINLITYLANIGAFVTVFDKNTKLIEENPNLNSSKIKCFLGDSIWEDLSKCDTFDYIFRSPGIKPFTEEVEEAVKKGSILTSEIEQVIACAPCKVIGITGSDGKTTTTTLVAKILEKHGYKVWLGGNIGVSLFTKLEEMKKEDIVVLELSSFQTMTLKDELDIAVITNVSPNHLDYHRSYEEYVDAKANVFKYQSSGKLIVLNEDNKHTKEYEDMLETRKNDIMKFSVEKELENGTYIKDGYIVYKKGEYENVIENTENIKLVGIHNLANICTAITAVYDLVNIEDIKSVITTFLGVEHRMEFVREFNNVKWYNDSIGTSPTRTIAGLVAMKKKIILIAGGYDKSIPYDKIGGYILDKVKTLILIGKTAPKIEKAVLDEIDRRNKNNITVEKIDIIKRLNLEEAVITAYNNSINGDIVVLSPASASFDLYKNFEERGNHFKKLVNDLK